MFVISYKIDFMKSARPQTTIEQLFRSHFDSSMSTTTAVQFWIPHQTLKRRRSPVTQVLTRDFFLSFKDGRGCRSSASSSSNYVVPMGKAESSVATRPLVEILRDLNKRVSDNVVNAEDNSVFWYVENKLLLNWFREI